MPGINDLGLGRRERAALSPADRARVAADLTKAEVRRDEAVAKAQDKGGPNEAEAIEAAERMFAGTVRTITASARADAAKGIERSREQERVTSKTAVAAVPRRLAASSVLPESTNERFLDAAVDVAGGATAATLLLTKAAPSDIAWAIGTGGTAVFAMVEGRGELHNFAAGWLAGTAAYLAGRIAQRTSIAGYASAYEARADGVRVRY